MSLESEFLDSFICTRFDRALVCSEDLNMSAYVLLSLTILQLAISYCILRPAFQRGDMKKVRWAAWAIGAIACLKIIGGVGLSAISFQEECSFQVFYGALCVFLGVLWFARAKRYYLVSQWGTRGRADIVTPRSSSLPDYVCLSGWCST